MTTQAVQERNLENSVSLGALAIAFLKVALYGIGGGGGLVWRGASPSISAGG